IYYFAWQDTAWENQLKRDLEDSTATWFPTAKLVWVTPELGYTPGPYLRNLKLAYEIRVFCLRPFFDRTYYVSAFRPWEVILFIDNIHTHNNSRATTTNSCQQGYALADVWYHGRRCIDIYKGVLKQKLIANDDGHDFETKYYEPIVPPEIAVDTPAYVWDNLHSIGISIFKRSWVGLHGEATSAHWFVQASWDYFRDFHYFQLSSQVRTIIRVPNYRSARSTKQANHYYLVLGETQDFFPQRALDIVAHEFTHHIIRETANLQYRKESGAINEAISDIFASVVEHWIEGSGASWELGELATNDPMLKRSLQNPKSLGVHVVPGPGCLYDLGQPDTYHGQYWYDVTSPDSCDNWGVHINSGVINYWFYLISRGGSGTNDHGWNYTVNPLPSEFKAAKIVFNALKNYLTPSATFHDFRIATLIAEKDSFNVCAYQKTIKQAWFAVGLSTDTVLEQPCNLIDNVSVPDNSVIDAKIIYVNNQYKLLTNQPVKVNIYNTTGQIIDQFQCNYSCELKLPNGLFLIKLFNNAHNYKILKLTINR
ncbi:MAG: M4 family metallopeptidase, partial [Chlorobi bacterium]|nr:M4 family metallopeptidase [Chlorobiota bacterium]